MDHLPSDPKIVPAASFQFFSNIHEIFSTEGSLLVSKKIKYQVFTRFFENAY
jgi:hypothetical protein